MTSQDLQRSRVHELDKMSREDLLTVYQRHLFHHAFEAIILDRDYLIAAILEMEDQP
jgi:hypothetical protein